MPAVSIGTAGPPKGIATGSPSHESTEGAPRAESVSGIAGLATAEGAPPRFLVGPDANPEAFAASLLSTSAITAGLSVLRKLAAALSSTSAITAHLTSSDFSQLMSQSAVSGSLSVARALAVAVPSVSTISASLSITSDAAMHLYVDTFRASGTWTAPSDVTSAFVECWGAGGDGSSETGGGGGAYAADTVAVTPANNYAVTVGISVTNEDGGETVFGANAVLAVGGEFGGSGGGQGGQAADCEGSIVFSGGNGAGGGANNQGGGAAGDSGAGSAGSANSVNNNGGARNGASALWPPASVPGAGGSDGGNGGVGEVRVTYSKAAAGGYAGVKSRNWGRTTANATTTVIDLPEDYAVGDRLLICFAVDGAENCTIAANGWTRLLNEQSSTVMTLAIFTKVAEGTGANPVADAATVAHTSEQASYFSLAFEAGGLPTLTGANGSSTTPDPPSHSPGASGKYYWLAVAGFDGLMGGIASWPTGYGDKLNMPVWSASDGVGIACAGKFAEASSEDPGTFSGIGGTNRRWACATIAVPRS